MTGGIVLSPATCAASMSKPGAPPDNRTYRAFHLDERGCITSAEIILVGSDDEAKAIAQMLARSHGIELWERGRRLARYPQDETAGNGGSSL